MAFRQYKQLDPKFSKGLFTGKDILASSGAKSEADEIIKKFRLCDRVDERHRLCPRVLEKDRGIAGSVNGRTLRADQQSF